MIRSRQRTGFTLAEILLVVALIGFITAIAMPSFFRARELSRQRACQEQLQKIYGAKNQFGLEQRVDAYYVPSWEDLVGNDKYLRDRPECPGGGTYTLNAISEDPECSLLNQDPYPHSIDASVAVGS